MVTVVVVTPLVVCVDDAFAVSSKAQRVVALIPQSLLVPNAVLAVLSSWLQSLKGSGA